MLWCIVTFPSLRGKADLMRPWPVLAVLCLALMLLGVDQTVINVTLPELQRDLGLSAAELQWVVGAYTLAMASCVLAAGNWGDRHGRRTALVVGLVVCALASVIGAVADSAAQVVAARAVMGLGAALIMPSTLSIVVHVFQDAARQRFAVTLWSTIAGVGVLVGPVLGGWLLRHYSWRASFWGNIALVALTLACVVVVVPSCREHTAPKPDTAGLALTSAGLFAITWSFIQAPTRGWTDGLVLTVAAAGLLSLVAMVGWERRVSAPMMPLGLFRDRRYAVAAGMLCLMFFTLVGSTFLLTFYLQGLRAMSPLDAGATLLTGGLSVAVGGLFSAVVTRWAEPRTVMVTGMVLCGSAFAVLAGITTSSPLGRLEIFLVLVGAGAGLAGGPATSLIMRAVPREKAGIGAGMNDAVRSMGSTSGVAVAGSVFNTVYATHMAHTSSGRLIDGGGAHDQILGALSEAKHLAAQAADGTAQLSSLARMHRLELAHRLVDDATQAFVAALRTTSWLCAAICVAGASLVLIALPGESRDPAMSRPPSEPRPMEQSGRRR
ncbi:MFS transporter [Streptomyces sp. NPDC048650]|uniref:MFS transporter n=1 Tax=Streptomyces sp. NPDC048650 TaxID=3365583 RepID=UPI003719F94C